MKTNDEKSLIIKEKPIKRDNLDNKYKVIKLSDIATLKNGYAFKESDYISDGEYNVITISNVKGNRYIENINCASKTKLPQNIMNHQILKENDILISMTGNVGRVSLNSGKNNLLNQRVGVLYVDSQIYVEWLFQYLSSKKFKEEMIIKSTGAAQKNISKEDIESFRLFVPSFEEQEKIGKMLQALDELILLYEEKLTALETYNKGLRQKLFDQSVSFKRPDGSSYPEWEEKKLCDVATLCSSKRIHASDYVEAGIPFYRGKEISQIKDNKQITDILYISSEKYNEIKKKYGSPQKGDLLITAVGTLGNTLVVSNDEPFYFKDGNLIWLKNICENPYFLDYAFNSQNGKKKIINSSIGSTQKALTIIKLNELKYRFPCLEEQQKIAEVLSCADELIQNTKEKTKALKTLKYGLLQHVFN